VQRNIYTSAAAIVIQPNTSTEYRGDRLHISISSYIGQAHAAARSENGRLRIIWRAGQPRTGSYGANIYAQMSQIGTWEDSDWSAMIRPLATNQAFPLEISGYTLTHVNTIHENFQMICVSVKSSQSTTFLSSFRPLHLLVTSKIDPQLLTTITETLNAKNPFANAYSNSSPSFLRFLQGPNGSSEPTERPKPTI